MRIICLLLFVVFQCSGQQAFFNSIGGRKSVGTLYDPSFSSSSGWSVSGTNDYNFTGKLQISGGNTSTYNKFLTLDNSYLNFRHRKTEFTFKIKDVSPSSNGFAVGWTSANPVAVVTEIIEINSQSGVIHAFQTVRGAENLHNAWVGATNLSCSLNDSCIATFTQTDARGSLVIRNVTAGTTATYTAIDDFYPNTSRLSVYSLGGTHEISRIQVSSDYIVGTDIVFIGNSLTTGYYSGPFSVHFSHLVGQNYSKMAVCSGGGDRTNEGLLNLTNILKLKPAKAIVEYGVNDIVFGNSQSTYISNLGTIYSTLHNAGVDVVILFVPPFTSGVSTSFNSAISSTFPKYVNIYSALVGSGDQLNPAFNSGDNVHWSAAGQAQVAATINSYLGNP
jgi:lysophospholipase L1-like esterase